MSPLMYAAREGRVAVCEKLLEHGAEINKQEMRGWTVSDGATEKIMTLELFLEYLHVLQLQSLVKNLTGSSRILADLQRPVKGPQG